MSLTLREAIKKRIKRVYDKKWASKKAYIKIPLIEPDKSGPWFYLYDREYQELLGLPTPQPILFTKLDFDADGLFEYSGEIDTEDEQPKK